MKQILIRLLNRRSQSSQPAARRSLGGRPLLEVLEDRAVPTAVTVTLLTDPLVTHTGTSLRDAIVQVNAGKADTINFAIPASLSPSGSPLAGGLVNSLNKPLPAISHSVTIDGTTEPGYNGTPLIGLTRAKASVKGDGLDFTAGGATVKGLAIYGFAGFGLNVTGANNSISADYIGVKADGTALENGTCGIFLNKANNTTVTSCTIGNNHHRGIRIDGSTNVTIGGQGAGNTISTNGVGDSDWAGIVIKSGSSAVTVSYNTITGDGRGIRIADAGATVAAGSTYSITIDHNTISGSVTQGVLIDNAFGGPAQNVLLSNNDIEGSTGPGVSVNHASNIAFTSNTIKGNQKDGILIGKGSTQVSFTSNDIENNGLYGVRIIPKAVASPDLTSNTITGNKKGAVKRG